jgi:hypothetical protein
MKTNFSKYLIPRYNAYVAGRKQQASMDGSTLDLPTISDFLRHNAEMRDKKTSQADADVKATTRPTAVQTASYRH